MEAGKQFKRVMGSCVAIALAIVFFLMVATQHIGAHTPVTSKYDYNKDVFPLFRDHCAVCHVAGGPAPMSLVTYKAAMPWAQSIRDELTAGRMPPWPVDPTSPPIKGGYPISSRDIDVMVVWASGGTPESYTDAKPPEVAFNPKWKLGPPDLKIAMDAEHTVPPSAIEEVSEFSLPINVTDTKWIKAADLMPGNPSIVRDAVISIENGPVLALWQPGSDTTAAPSGAAFRLAPGLEDSSADSLQEAFRPGAECGLRQEHGRLVLHRSAALRPRTAVVRDRSAESCGRSRIDVLTAFWGHAPEGRTHRRASADAGSRV